MNPEHPVNPVPAKPCQFTIVAGGGICGQPAVWQNRDTVHGNCCFCQAHKEELERDEFFGGEWFFLQHSTFIIQPSP